MLVSSLKTTEDNITLTDNFPHISPNGDLILHTPLGGTQNWYDQLKDRPAQIYLQSTFPVSCLKQLSSFRSALFCPEACNNYDVIFHVVIVKLHPIITFAELKRFA